MATSRPQAATEIDLMIGEISLFCSVLHVSTLTLATLQHGKFIWEHFYLRSNINGNYWPLLNLSFLKAKVLMVRRDPEICAGICKIRIKSLILLSSYGMQLDTLRAKERSCSLYPF